MDKAQQDEVRKQLGHLLAYPAFSRAPRLSALLSYIVQETLAERGNQLKEYSLGVTVLGRGSQFDPRLDSIVRVQASHGLSRTFAM